MTPAQKDAFYANLGIDLTDDPPQDIRRKEIVKRLFAGSDEHGPVTGGNESVYGPKRFHKILMPRFNAYNYKGHDGEERGDEIKDVFVMGIRNKAASDEKRRQRTIRRNAQRRELKQHKTTRLSGERLCPSNTRVEEDPDIIGCYFIWKTPSHTPARSASNTHPRSRRVHTPPSRSHRSPSSGGTHGTQRLIQASQGAASSARATRRREPHMEPHMEGGVDLSAYKKGLVTECAMTYNLTQMKAIELTRGEGNEQQYTNAGWAMVLKLWTHYFSAIGDFQNSCKYGAKQNRPFPGFINEGDDLRKEFERWREYDVRRQCMPCVQQRADLQWSADVQQQQLQQPQPQQLQQPQPQQPQPQQPQPQPLPQPPQPLPPPQQPLPPQPQPLPLPLPLQQPPQPSPSPSQSPIDDLSDILSPGGLSQGGLSPGGLSPGGLSPGGYDDDMSRILQSVSNHNDNDDDDDDLDDLDDDLSMGSDGDNDNDVLNV